MNNYRKTKKADENTKGKDITYGSQFGKKLDESAQQSTVNPTFGPTELNVSQEVMEEDRRIDHDLVTHRQNPRQKYLLLPRFRENREEMRSINSISKMECQQQE